MSLPFMPPNGAISVEMRSSLMPAMPPSSHSGMGYIHGIFTPGRAKQPK
jgi:hypothetical protein